MQLPAWILAILLSVLALTGGDVNKSQMRAPQALGQMIVARFDGPEPSRTFLKRIRAGEIGSVILFSEGLGGGESAIAARIDRLQRAARLGGNPPLLVMVDQEGGKVRRLQGPPRVTAAAVGSRRESRTEGEATAAMLEGLGINVDLAPVADLGRPGSFLGPRAFASSPAQVARLACGFADGLRHGGTIATLKHFPGLGLAGANTDEEAVTIRAPKALIRSGYAPYQACASAPLTMVMVSSAIYPKLTGKLPAVMSPGTYSGELPRAGAEEVVTISDALETPAIEAFSHPARRAVAAGLDLLLYAKTESASATAYDQLLEDIERGHVRGADVRRAASAIVALKRELSSTPPATPSLPPASG